MSPSARTCQERVLDLDDARVVVRQLGSAASHMVFVHGWACRAEDWLPVAEALEGSTLWMVDLPGHGASTSRRDRWDIASLGMLMARVLDELSLPACVLVGHSMGGAVAVEAALRSDRVARVVCLEALTYPAIYPAQPAEAVEEALAPFRADFRGAIQGLVAALFPEGSRTELVQPIADEMGRAEPGPAVALLAELLRWDMATALQSLTVRLDVVASQALLTDEGRRSVEPYARLRHVSLGGHFFLREDPVATARALQAVLSDGA